MLCFVSCLLCHLSGKHPLPHPPSGGAPGLPTTAAHVWFAQIEPASCNSHVVHTNQAWWLSTQCQSMANIVCLLFKCPCIIASTHAEIPNATCPIHALSLYASSPQIQLWVLVVCSLHNAHSLFHAHWLIWCPSLHLSRVMLDCTYKQADRHAGRQRQADKKSDKQTYKVTQKKANFQPYIQTNKTIWYKYIFQSQGWWIHIEQQK